MISNKGIIEKINSKTEGNDIMNKFLMDILEHENENSHYSKKYKQLIEKAVKDLEAGK